MNKDKLKQIKLKLEEFKHNLMVDADTEKELSLRDIILRLAAFESQVIIAILEEEVKESKPDKIKRLVARLCDLYSYRGADIALSQSNFDFEEIEELEKQLDELLKDL